MYLQIYTITYIIDRTNIGSAIKKSDKTELWK